MVYVWPNQKDSKVEFRARYQNFIGGEWTRPVKEQYFENITPVTGRSYCEVPRSTAEDVEKALDAAYAAKSTFARTTLSQRSILLSTIADRIEQNIEKLAVAETWDSGKPIRETLSADLPLCVEQFRYYSGLCRADQGCLTDIDDSMVGYSFHEPLGVVAQMLPWSFPLLSASAKLAVALAAGNCTILKPAEQTPASLLVMMDILRDILPPGVVNVLNGYALECNRPLAANRRVAKLGFWGDSMTGRQMMQYAAEYLTPLDLDISGKSPSLYFEDIVGKNDEYYERCVEAFTMFAQGQGELCGGSSRALIDAKIFSRFLERAIERTRKYVPGNPLDTTTTVGALVSNAELERVQSYVEMGKREGAKLLLGGDRARLGGELSNGYYLNPTIFQGNAKMRTFQEEVFGPVLTVTSFRDYDDAIALANDTYHAPFASLWTRDPGTAYRAARALRTGRVYQNSSYLYPAYTAFGAPGNGYGKGGYCGQLYNYQLAKNLFVSYETRPSASL